MNTHEACNILGVPIGSSPEGIKKAFKKAAIKYHPDRNKTPGAEQKFKQINEAFQFLEKHGAETSTNPFASNYDHGDHLANELRKRMNNFFNKDFYGTPKQSIPPVVVPAEIPFILSILGGKHEVQFDRFVKCESCNNGKCKIQCPKCNATKYRKYGDSEKELPCTSCNDGYVESSVICTVCGGAGAKKELTVLKVGIPPGTESGKRFIFNSKGNYASGSYGNVSVIISVLPDEELKLNDQDVISTVELSLLEALKGTKKEVKTINGNKTLSFKPGTKHKDTVKVAGYGVPPQGAHLFTIHVNYPDNVDGIVKILEENSSNEDLGDNNGV